MVRTPARLVLAIASALLLVLAAGSLLAPAHAAKGGNSANAKLCQKGGFQTLFTSTGATFTSEEQCTSYAAQGGALRTAPPSRYQAQIEECQSFQGQFAEAAEGALLYRCDHPAALTSDQYDQVATSCASAGGAYTFVVSQSPPFSYSCYRI